MIRRPGLTAGTTKFALGFIDNGGNTDVGFFTQRSDFGTADILQCDICIGGSLAAFYVAGWDATVPYDTDIVVDDIRVFNTALTQTQVASAMATPVV